MVKYRKWMDWKDTVMKKKLILSVAFAISLLPMLMNQYGGLKGVIGIVISEIYKFFTWHVMTITGEISIQNSIQFAFPEFYIGLAVSLIMVVAYFVINKVIKE